MTKNKKDNQMNNKNSSLLSKILGITLAIGTMASSSTLFAASEGHWGYSGENGPANWSKLSDEYSACNNGKNQSPILINNLLDADLPKIPFVYSTLIGDSIVNNGHTIKVNVRTGGEIVVDGKSFKLKQFHYHSSSEHMINGKFFPVEVHFVHQAEDGTLAVLAKMYSHGSPDPLLNILFSKMPMKKGQSARLNPKDLQMLEIDSNLKHYYRYNGSLTTPPCSEGVIWLIGKSNLQISNRQLKRLHDALKKPNNRPIQPTNARLIVH